MSVHLPSNVSVTLQLVSTTSRFATVDNKGPTAVSNQNKTSLSSTLLQRLCLTKPTKKAFHPLLSHESPTDYDRAKLLLLSDRFVVKGFYVEEEPSKHKAYQVFVFLPKTNVQQCPSMALLIIGLFMTFRFRTKKHSYNEYVREFLDKFRSCS